MNVNVGIIGCGYWGKNLIRNFIEAKNCWLSTICDSNEELLQKVQKRYPSLTALTNYRDVMTSKDINTVVIATPVSQHYPLAKEALLAGKHVLVEKPLAASAREVEELIALADKQKKVLMVDHTFLYTGAVRKIKNLIDSGTIGKLLYYDSVRVNLGLFQQDINVIWDLAPHDLSIMDYLVKEKPVSVRAMGMAHLTKGIENIGYMILNFNNDMIAHFHFNWMSPVKVRLAMICGSEKMIVYDDIEPSEKVKIYERKVELMKSVEDKYRLYYDYRVGDLWVPKIELTEALSLMTQDFIEAILTGKKPLSDAQSGLRVVRILEAAQKSISSGGDLISI